MDDLEHRILILESDREQSAKLAAYLYESCNCFVSLIQDASDGLRLIRESRGLYDVLLLDEPREPNAVSLALLDLIRAEFPEIQVLLLSDRGPNPDIQILQTDAYRYVPKPYPVDKLAEIICLVAQKGRFQRDRQTLLALYQAKDELGQAGSKDAVLRQIVQSATVLLNADYALISRYDDERDVFFPEERQAQNIPEHWLREFREDPKPGRTERRVLEEGYLSIGDIESPAGDTIRPATREFLRALGVRALQAVRLSVGDEKLAVLFVNYKQPRMLSSENDRALAAFADHSALVLKNALLLEQLQRTSKAAQLVAEVTVRDGLRETLQTIVDHAQAILGSDVITVFVFEEESRQLGEWVTAGIEHDSACPSEFWDKSVIALILDSPKLYELAEFGSPEHPLLKSNFARTHHFGASIGIRLQVGDRRVGVMFFNYKTAHRFSNDEIETIRLFANQAAVAIHASQLRDEEKKRAHGQLATAYREVDNRNKQLEDFVYLFTHHWFAAPAHVKNTLDLFLAGKFDPAALTERQASELREAQTELEVYLEHLDDIRTVIRVERGMIELDSRPLFIESIVDHVARLHARAAQQKGIMVRIPDLQPRLALVGDESKLRIVFSNLLENAIKFTPRGGEICIHLQSDQTAIGVLIDDNGPGMPPELKGRLGEKFYSRGGAQPGTGLGVYFAKKYLELHGGSLNFPEKSEPGFCAEAVLPRNAG